MQVIALVSSPGFLVICLMRREKIKPTPVLNPTQIHI